MKKLTAFAVALMAVTMVAGPAFAQNDGDRPRDGERGPRDGERGERGPRDGDRGERGPRDGDRPPQDGERRGRDGGGRGFGGPPPNPIMEALDADKDGVLSAEEIRNAVVALKKLDKDSDGKLTAEELRPPGGDRRGFGGSGGPGGPGGPGFGGPGGPGGGPEDFIARLMEYDKNKDGKLAKDELPEFMADRMMERADTNKDNFLEKSELQEMARNFQRGGGRGREGGARPGEGRPGGGRPDADGESRRPRRPESDDE